MLFSLVLSPKARCSIFSPRPIAWWFAGAWVLWIAYAGLNLCLPNLMLKLSRRRFFACHWLSACHWLGRVPRTHLTLPPTSLSPGCATRQHDPGGWLFDRYGGALSIFSAPRWITTTGFSCRLGGAVPGHMALLLVVEKREKTREKAH